MNKTSQPSKNSPKLNLDVENITEEEVQDLWDHCSYSPSVEKIERLDQAIKLLPGKDKVLHELLFIKGMKQVGIARKLKMTKTAVSEQKERLINKLLFLMDLPLDKMGILLQFMRADNSRIDYKIIKAFLNGSFSVVEASSVSGKSRNYCSNVLKQACHSAQASGNPIINNLYYQLWKNKTMLRNNKDSE
jgi:hypothetical protein